jgi:hypothetical protein
MLTPILFFAQNSDGNIQIKDLEMPNAPALTLLDQTTANIETPKNIQALTTTIMNNINNNFGLEINPYMILNTRKNFYDFYNVKWNDTKNEFEHQGWFTSIIKDLSISFAKVKKDSTNYLSIGARTNLIRIVANRKAFSKSFTDLESLFEKTTMYSPTKDDIYDYQDLVGNVLEGNTTIFDLTEGDFIAINNFSINDKLSNELNTFLSKANITQNQLIIIRKKGDNKETIWQIIERYKGYRKASDEYLNDLDNYYSKADSFRKNFASNLNILQDDIPKPLFTLDAAFAYSMFYPNNNYSDGETGKFGVWSTANLNLKLPSDDNKEYLSFYAYGRYLKDNAYLDSDTNTYIHTDYFDIGTKIELEYHKLTFGYEYIHRDKGSDNYRSVGSIKYKFSDTITLTGGFGKNFEQKDNLVSIIGINWGIESNNNFSTDPKK